MKIVTSGFPYIDIDAYGGSITYAELLNLLGEPAAAISTAPLNESITSTVLSWGAKLGRDYQASPDDIFVMIDLSNPKVFDKIVDLARVVEIIDHHMELADYWRQELGDKAHIEFVGAACTLVYERWKRAGKLASISQTSARLLIAGILDNTLNLRASVTTKRDHEALTELGKYANLPSDWAASYFTECEQAILSDVARALINDTKFMLFPSRPNMGVGQMVVWNGRAIVDDHLSEVHACMSTAGSDWFVNIVSIGEGKNYLFAGNDDAREFLQGLLEVRFDGSIATTDRLWLRKEIVKQDLDRQSKVAV